MFVVLSVSTVPAQLLMMLLFFDFAVDPHSLPRTLRLANESPLPASWLAWRGALDFVIFPCREMPQ
jgi:hypothetical protein